MSIALLRTVLWTDPLIVLATAVMGTINMAVAPFDSHGHVQMRLAKTWARMLVRILGIRLEITGIEHLEPGKNYIFAGNHRSYTDTPVLLKALPGNFRFMAKEALFKIPLMGHHLKTAGHIPVSLVNPREALRSLNRAGELIRERGISIMIFPEGGRTQGALEPFKEGAAIIAIKSGLAIVPFGLLGTRDVLPMHSTVIRPGTVRLRIGRPIETTGMVFKNKTELTQRLRTEVAALLGIEP